jgi:putative IMPACT (imprinted ancient) family translation regulator
VTRYFGGVLLGTGGLVRAYSKAAQEGLKASRIIDRIEGSVLRIRTDYNGVGKIQYLLGKRELTITDSVYADNVELGIFATEFVNWYVGKYRCSMASAYRRLNQLENEYDYRFIRWFYG